MPERIDLLKLERRFLLFRKSGRSTAFLDLCASPVIFRVHAASREDIDVDRLICLKARTLNASLIAFAAAGSLEAAKAQFVTNKSLTHLLLAEMTWALFTENQLLRLR
ncbi:unnamed protein product, partial [Porites evermanni]